MTKLITVSKFGAAEMLGTSVTSVEKIIQSGDLPVRRFGNRTLIKVSDLEAFVDRLPTGPAPAPAQLEGRRTGRPRKLPATGANHG